MGDIVRGHGPSPSCFLLERAGVGGEGGSRVLAAEARQLEQKVRELFWVARSRRSVEAGNSSNRADGSAKAKSVPHDSAHQREAL